MNQEDKELLLKDLCARLPYHPIVYGKTGYARNKGHLTIVTSSGCTIMTFTGSTIHYFFEEVKPYLRPMSSMTKEERDEYVKVIVKSQDCSLENSESATTMANDWLLSKGFDVRGLISKGLALEAPNEMYK